jgi:hypothetical protein
MLFEQRHEPLLSSHEFARRFARWVGAAAAIVLGSLAFGIVGYHYTEGLPWIDSLLNASMILGGMGPVDVLTTDAAKVFASGYALFSGVAFLTSVGVFLAPALHRLLHHFHLQVDDGEEAPREKRHPRP